MGKSFECFGSVYAKLAEIPRIEERFNVQKLANRGMTSLLNKNNPLLRSKPVLLRGYLIVDAIENYR